jgi:hypothetical protein
MEMVPYMVACLSALAANRTETVSCISWDTEAVYPGGLNKSGITHLGNIMRIYQMKCFPQNPRGLVDFYNAVAQKISSISACAIGFSENKLNLYDVMELLLYKMDMDMRKVYSWLRIAAGNDHNEQAPIVSTFAKIQPESIENRSDFETIAKEYMKGYEQLKNHKLTE